MNSIEFDKNRPDFQAIRDYKSIRDNAKARNLSEAKLLGLNLEDEWELLYTRKFTRLEKSQAWALAIGGMLLSFGFLVLAYHWGSDALDIGRFGDRNFWKTSPFLKTFLAATLCFGAGFTTLKLILSYYWMPKYRVGKIQRIRYHSDANQNRWVGLTLHKQEYFIPKDLCPFLWTDWLIRIQVRRMSQEVLKLELEVQPPEYTPVVQHSQTLTH